MFFFMTTNKKQQCYPLCFFSWRPIKNYSVTPFVFLHDDQRKTCFMFEICFIWWISTVLPPMFYLMNIDSVTLYVSFDKNDSVTTYVFFSWLMKNNSYPLYFIWQGQLFIFFKYGFYSWRPIKKQQCYPLYFIWQKQQCYPLCFFWKRQVLPLMFFFMMTNKKQQWYPLCFFLWRPIKNNSVTPYISFDKNNSVTPYVLFDKNNSATPYVFFYEVQ